MRPIDLAFVLGSAASLIWVLALTPDRMGQRDRTTVVVAKYTPAPPMEIQQIAHAMDLGYHVDSAALDKLSAYIEENQATWNAWCEQERTAR